MKKGFEKKFVIFIFLILSLVRVVNAANLYVSSSGSGTACTQSSPCSLSTANSNVLAGDTAYLRGGTYSTTIRPSNSGSDGNYITYTNYNDETVTITTSGDGANLASRSYIVIDGLRFEDVGSEWIQFEPNGHHNIIKNCHMEEAGAYAGLNIEDGADYNKILNNVLISVCPCSSPCDQGGPSDLIQIWSAGHNLIEGNELYGGHHDSIDAQDRIEGSSNYNIIRNNYIQNRWHSTLNIIAFEYILIENNVVADGGEDRDDNFCGSERDRNMARVEHKGIALQASYSIVRNNVAVNNGYGVGPNSGGGASDTKYPWKNPCGDNRIYNNVMTKCYSGIRRNDPDPLIAPVYFKNNIIYDNTNYGIDIYGPNDPENSIYIIHNNILGGSNRYDSSLYIVQNNLATNPLFTDESNRDFTLQEDSPMIDAGAWLTTTTSAGSGTTLVVDDARYFMDGWGIIEGDQIQLQGQTQTATITNVDYNTNTLTLDTSLTWTSGQGVSLPYSGTKPDIGALEYGGALRHPRRIDALMTWTVYAALQDRNVQEEVFRHQVIALLFVVLEEHARLLHRHAKTLVFSAVLHALQELRLDLMTLVQELMFAAQCVIRH